MSNEFMREERYIVFKTSDLGNSLKGDEIRRLAREYAEQRRLKGKKPLECVVVEKDWPEYEPTWKAIEARVTGTQPAPSVPDGYLAGVKAVAAMVQKKADDYANEHGYDDIGGLSFGSGMNGEIKTDHYTNLLELVDEVNAMLAAAPEVKP